MESIKFHDITIYDKQLVAGSSNGLIWVWDSTSGKLVKKLEGHTDMVLSVAFSQTGVLFSGSKDKTVRKWDMKQ